MIKNNKADTILNFNKKRYPLRPILVSKNESKETLTVSVEPGTIVDIVKRQEFSVLEKREFFELRKGESLCIVANVDFQKKVKSGDILSYDFSDPNDEETKKKVAKRTYQVYVNRYDIKDFKISIINQEDLESMKNHLQLCFYGEPQFRSSKEGFIEFVFNDENEFNQMYVQGGLIYYEGVEFYKTDENPPSLPEPPEGEYVGGLSYFF